MSRLCREDLEKKVRARVERRMSKLWGNRPPSHGLFGHKPGTQEEHLIWTVSRHKTIQLAGIRALVLQLSDPVIAQGVNDYSRFRTEPQDRVKKTFGAIAAVLYGNRAQVVDALVGIYMAHTTIKGVLSVASGGKARVGESYKATSRVSSGYWVFATVVEAIIHGFQATVRELDKTELDELCGDCMRLGRALYVRESHLPKTWADFRKDFDQRIEASAVHRTQEDLVEHLEQVLAVRRPLVDPARVEGHTAVHEPAGHALDVLVHDHHVVDPLPNPVLEDAPDVQVPAAVDHLPGAGVDLGQEGPVALGHGLVEGPLQPESPGGEDRQVDREQDQHDPRPQAGSALGPRGSRSCRVGLVVHRAGVRRPPCCS
mgnify:CR=1 FL=1